MPCRVCRCGRSRSQVRSAGHLVPSPARWPADLAPSPARWPASLAPSPGRCCGRRRQSPVRSCAHPVLFPDRRKVNRAPSPVGCYPQPSACRPWNPARTRARRRGLQSQQSQCWIEAGACPCSDGGGCRGSAIRMPAPWRMPPSHALPRARPRIAYNSPHHEGQSLPHHRGHRRNRESRRACNCAPGSAAAGSRARSGERRQGCRRDQGA